MIDECHRAAAGSYQAILDHARDIITSRVKTNASERVFLATYPAMQKVFQSFDPGFFDLIIADESHRSIYNVYGDIFHYFDCHQVGLTATPVDFVTRSTFRLFGCEGQLPTSNYDLERRCQRNCFCYDASRKGLARLTCGLTVFLTD